MEVNKTTKDLDCQLPAEWIVQPVIQTGVQLYVHVLFYQWHQPNSCPTGRCDVSPKVTHVLFLLA